MALIEATDMLDTFKSSNMFSIPPTAAGSLKLFDLTIQILSYHTDNIWFIPH